MKKIYIKSVSEINKINFGILSKTIVGLFLIIAIIAIIASCSALKSLENIMKLKFKINSVSNFEVQDISVQDKAQLADFSSTDILKLLQAFSSQKLFATFILNIDVQNPNARDGSSNNLNLEIVSFPWELFFNGKNLISGNIQEPIKLVGTNYNEKLKIKITLNLFDILNNSNINELLKVALNLGGRNASTNKLSLFAQPVIGTFIGNISYPEKIKIVDYEFRWYNMFYPK